MSYNSTTFDEVNHEMGNLATRTQEIQIQLDEHKESTSSVDNVLSIAQTLFANTEMRIAAVEDRLTARETSHMALVNQLNDILGQMQVKLQGALELKPEIMPYDNALAAGYLDTETGIKLRADATAQRKFTSQLLILRTAVEYAGAPTNMPVRLWDYNGNTHEIPFTAYVGLMLRFGAYVAQVEASF